MRLLLAVLALVVCAGCGSLRNEWVGIKSSVTMLDTHITLFTANGDTIASWHTMAKVQTAGGEAWWVDDAGIQHHISGTFIVRGE